jgi:lysophospholipase L1-like esterase
MCDALSEAVRRRGNGRRQAGYFAKGRRRSCADEATVAGDPGGQNGRITHVRRLIFAMLVLLVPGCGQGSEPARRDTVVAALGDSITAGSPAWDPDPAIRERIGPDVDPDSQFPLWAQVRLGRGYSVRNCGVFGERTDQIAARLERCAAGADALIVQGGINDIAQGRPVEEAAADLRAMVRRGRALGLRVMVTDVLPWNNGDARAARQIARLNRLIASMAREERVPLLPFNRALADPRDSDRMRAALTADGDHPSVAGYRRLGALVPRR